MRQFHHIGLPTDQKQPGEVYVPDTKVWVTNPDDHPYRVEFLRFEPGTPVAGPVRDMAHVAFKTDNLKREIRGAKVLLGPFQPMPGLQVVFVLKDGAVFEFMQFD